MSPSCKQICQKGVFSSEVCLCTSVHMCVPGQAGMKGQCPTSRRLPGTCSLRGSPAAVLFGRLKVPAPRTETPLARSFLLRCRQVFVGSYRCLSSAHCVYTGAGITYFCKERWKYNFQKKREPGWVLLRCPVSVAGFASSWCDLHLGGWREITYLIWKKISLALIHELKHYLDLECLLVEDLIFLLFLTCIQEQVQLYHRDLIQLCNWVFRMFIILRCWSPLKF